jgi:hypothetical protein
LARVGRTQAQVDALPNKAASGMNIPGVELDIQTPLTITVPHNATKLVWLKTDGTLALSADLASGQQYRDVAPELQHDPNMGALINTTGFSQKGPLRQPEPASILLGKVVSSADTGTVTFGGVFDNTETATITIGGTAVVVTSTVNGTTAAQMAALAKTAIEANATAAAKVSVSVVGAVATLTSKDATAYTLTAADTAAAGTATASGANLAGAAITSVDNRLRSTVLLGNGNP